MTPEVEKALRFVEDMPEQYATLRAHIEGLEGEVEKWKTKVEYLGKVWKAETEDATKAHGEIARLRARVQRFKDMYNKDIPVKDEKIEKLERVMDEIRKAVLRIQTGETWVDATVIQKIIVDGTGRLSPAWDKPPCGTCGGSKYTHGECPKCTGEGCDFCEHTGLEPCPDCTGKDGEG